MAHFPFGGRSSPYSTATVGFSPGVSQVSHSSTLDRVRPSSASAYSDFSHHYSVAGAKYPHYANISLRIGSFLNWPEEKDQTPLSLAEAGFYFAGVQDCTRCFHCGGGLRNWLPADIPWAEHARWFTDCEFVRLKKGAEFVARVNVDYPREGVEVVETDTDTTGTDYNEIVQRILQKPCGVSLEVLDFPQTIIIAAITKVLSESEWDENQVTAAKLAQVAFDLQEAESSSTSDYVGAETIREDGPAMEPPSLFCESSGVNNDSSCGALMEENSRLKNQMTCRVCKRNSVSNVFLPCGHLVTCPECGLHLTHCVLCHQTIAANIKVYV